MSEGGQKKRKSKAWYRKQASINKRMKTDHKPGHRLTAGLKGFIITCNEHEKDAVKESYNILNEYADKLYGPETKGEAESSGESDGDDIEAAIAKEIQSLKDATAKGQRRFQNSQTGAKNCIFIKTTLDDPVGLAHAIFTDLHQSKLQKSRHALRLLPVVGTCKANIKEINKLAKVVLQPFFTDTKFEVTFTITFKARNNNGIGREMTISTLRETIMETFPSTLLCFTYVNPQITVLVEVMCGVACIAVAKDFAHFRKYNLVEVVHDKPAESKQTNSTVQSEQSLAAKNVDSDRDKVESQQEEMNEVSCGKLDICCLDSKLITAAAKGREEDPDIPNSSQQESPGAVSSTSELQSSGKIVNVLAASECIDVKLTDTDVTSAEPVIKLGVKSGEPLAHTGEASGEPQIESDLAAGVPESLTEPGVITREPLTDTVASGDQQPNCPSAETD